MTYPGPDPLLPLMCMGRPFGANNQFRAKLIAEAAITQRRDPDGFKAFVLQHLEWAVAEAIARDRAGQDVQAFALLAPAAAAVESVATRIAPAAVDGR